jgi:hypothetical protein
MSVNTVSSAAARADAFDQARFLKALNAGNLPLMPDKNGYADTRPVGNPLTGRQYTGIEAVFLKAHSKSQGLNSSEFVSLSQMSCVLKETGFSTQGRSPEAQLKAGARLTVLNYSEERRGKDGSMTRITCSQRLINLDQTPHSQRIKDYAQAKGIPPFNMARPGLERPGQGTSITCVSTDPAQVMGLYLAALQTGRPFKISTVQYQEWTKKTCAMLSGPGVSPASQSKSQARVSKAAAKPEPAASPSRPLKFAAFALAATKIAANVALAVVSPAPALAAGIAGVAALAGAASQALTR